MRHPSWLCNYSLTNETPSWHHLRSKICVNHCLLIVHCVYMRIWGSYIRCSNTGAVWLWWCSWLGHTHTLTHYLARHSPAQDGRGHKPSQITINSMAWLLNLLNFYHFNHVRYSIENESIFCIKIYFTLSLLKKKLHYLCWKYLVYVSQHLWIVSCYLAADGGLLSVSFVSASDLI